MQRTRLLRCVLLLAAAGCAAAQQGCSINSTVTLRNFNKAGAGANGNPDFGFLPEPADVSDKRIVKATLSAAAKPVYSPATGFNTTTTHSQLDFNQWFSTAAAYQQDAVLTLAETTDSSNNNLFQFNNAAFWPLDGQLLGASSPGAHNRYFTMELHSTLKYLQSSAGVLEFTTNCDLFVYLNGERIINLGGVHLAQSASIVLNQIGLQNGLAYPIDIFLAQRHGPGATPAVDITSSVDFASGKTADAYCSGAAGRGADGSAVNATGLDAQFPTTTAPPADGFPGVPGCNSVWGVAGGDTCGKIATASGLENAASVIALNPGLDCSALQPGQLVCTGTGGAPTATCGFRLYETGAGDTCLTVRNDFGTNGVPIKFAVLQALNPGALTFPAPQANVMNVLRNVDVDCGAAGQTALPAGTAICLPQVPGQSAGGRRRLQSITNASGDAGVMPLLAENGMGGQSGFLGGHLPSLLQGFSDATQDFRRSLQQSGGACIGGSFTVQLGGCSLTCASAAQQAGLTVTQLVLLNPQLVDNASKTCRVAAGQTLCRGCTGTVCGVKVSDTLSEFLNFPDLNLLMCGLLADCGNAAYTEGAAGAQDEQLVITITKQTASTRAYTAAGGSQIAPFFAADGYGATNPVSALSLSIYPSYYSGVEAVAKGGNAGLASWTATVALTDAEAGSATTRRQLLGFRLPRYVPPKRKYRQTSANPRTMVISRYRRIW